MTKCDPRLFHIERIHRVACRVKNIVPVERIGQLLAHKTSQELLAHRLWNFSTNERSPERLAVVQAIEDGIAFVANSVS